MDTRGRIRSSQSGSHRIARPGRCISDGTSPVRRTNASIATAAAGPTPSSAMTRWSPKTKAVNTQIMDQGGGFDQSAGLGLTDPDGEGRRARVVGQLLHPTGFPQGLLCLVKSLTQPALTLEI